MDREDPLLTPGQVASLLQISPGTVSRLLRIGRLPGVKLGRQWRIRRDDLDRYLGPASNPDAAQDILTVCPDRLGIFSAEACDEAGSPSAR